MSKSRISKLFHSKARIVGNNKEPFVTIGEAGAVLLLTYAQVRAWCQENEQKLVRVKTTFLLSEANVLELYEANDCDNRIYAEVMALRDRVRHLESELSRLRESRQERIDSRKTLRTRVEELKAKNAKAAKGS